MSDPATSLALGLRNALKDVSLEFERNSECYYTERDLVFRVVGIMRHEGCDLCAVDKDGRKQTLLHTEYPTPFKCDMNGDKFEAKPDDSSFRRGFYDLVILNPGFVRDHSYDVVNGQDFRKLRAAIREGDWSKNPFILVAGEFMFARKPLKFSRGKDREKGIDSLVSKVRQDFAKLDHSRKHGFVKEIVFPVFIRGSRDGEVSVQALLDERLREIGPEITPVYDS